MCLFPQKYYNKCTKTLKSNKKINKTLNSIIRSPPRIYIIYIFIYSLYIYIYYVKIKTTVFIPNAGNTGYGKNTSVMGKSYNIPTIQVISLLTCVYKFVSNILFNKPVSFAECVVAKYEGGTSPFWKEHRKYQLATSPLFTRAAMEEMLIPLKLIRLVKTMDGPRGQQRAETGRYSGLPNKTKVTCLQRKSSGTRDSRLSRQSSQDWPSYLATQTTWAL